MADATLNPTDTRGISLGTLIIGGVTCVALAETPVAPLIAGLLVAAIVYNGLQLYGQTNPVNANPAKFFAGRSGAFAGPGTQPSTKG